MGNLDGKVAIVTGASRDIGRTAAERLAGEGARVAINYARSADKANEVVSAIENGGGEAFAVQADMSERLEQPEDIADVVAFLVGEEARWITAQNIRVGGGVV